LTHAGAFGFGAGWEWVPTDAEIVRRLLVFLADRRALAYDHHREDVDRVVESILGVRKELTKTLQELAPGSGASHSVRELRDACVRFLDRTKDARGGMFDQTFVDALEDLRSVFVDHVRILADGYKITIDGPLAEALSDADRAARARHR
jgi:hypothetical protein